MLRTISSNWVLFGLLRTLPAFLYRLLWGLGYTYRYTYISICIHVCIDRLRCIYIYAHTPEIPAFGRLRRARVGPAGLTSCGKGASTSRHRGLAWSPKTDLGVCKNQGPSYGILYMI